jgi:hypothetical protein
LPTLSSTGFEKSIVSSFESAKGTKRYTGINMCLAFPFSN